MEQYSHQVLLLFLAYREREDLLLNNSFTERLRHAISTSKIDSMNLKFLQNLQDCKSNSFRMTLLKDDLQRHTLPLSEADVNEYMQHEQEEECIQDVSYIENLFELLEDEDEMQHQDDGHHECIPANYYCDIIRNKGRLACGYTCLPSFDTNNLPATSFVHRSEQIREDIQGIGENEATTERENPTQRQIVDIFLTHHGSEPCQFNMDTNENFNVLVANGSAASIIDWSRKSGLDIQQRRAFEIITSQFVLTFYNDAEATSSARSQFNVEKKRLELLSETHKRIDKPLIMFVHGAAGSGKTALVDLAIMYAKSYCKLVWPDFTNTERAITVTAMTGVAATLLQGQTTHTALYLNQKVEITPQQIELWRLIRMVIIDEISFATNDDIKLVHIRLNQLKEKFGALFGGMPVIFSGDLRQLEPVGKYKKPIYAECLPYFRDWVNCYIELDGIHRFRHDPEWGRILMRFRNGSATRSDIDMINSRVVKADDLLPENTTYATYNNLDRDAINTAILHNRAQEFLHNHGNTEKFIMIFSDNLQMQNFKKYITFKKTKSFWENCGEDDIKKAKGAGRMDPVLKVYQDCKIMLPKNEDVESGNANGTTAKLQRVVLKSGVRGRYVLLDNNIRILSVFAPEVDYVELKHCNERMQPQLFRIKPSKHTFKVMVPKPKALQQHSSKHREKIAMKATQIPMLVNNATTGHKLQGTGVEQLFIHTWNNTRNWVYTTLSRVRTLKGLFLRQPLGTNLSKYDMPQALRQMIQNFESRKPSMFTDDQYTKISSGNLSELDALTIPSATNP